MQVELAAEICAAIEAGELGQIAARSLHFGLLDELNSPVVQVLYGHLLGSPSVSQRILGMSGRISSGDVSALASVSTEAPSYGRVPELPVLVLGIRDHFRNTDPAGIAVLGELATDAKSYPSDLREAAAHALGAIHSREALPYLAQLL